MIAGVLFSTCLGQTCYQPATPLGAPVLPSDGPIADAGADQAVNSGDSVTLNALASYDPGGELLQYFWVQLSGPPVTLDDANSPRPTFSAPEAGIYEFVLTVIDSFGRTREDIVRIVVGDEDENAPGATDITVSAGDDQIASEGETVHLVGQAQSAAGGELSYTWVQLDGPPVDLVGATQAAASFVAPQVDLDTTLSFSFTAEDGTASASVRIAVVVLNVAEPASADLALEIIATPAEPEVLEEIAFQTQTVDGQTAPDGVYRWDFGDGQMAEGRTATHAFSASGTYAVSLCVTIGVGFAANVSCTEKAVTVRAAVVAGGAGGSGTTTPTTFTITGTTMDDSGAPLGGLVVAGNNGASTAVSATATGAYEITVPRDWTGRVTPQYAGHVFTPPYRDYPSPVAANKTEQNFIATPAHNAPPVADPQSVTVAEDGSVLIVLTGSDPTGHDLTFIVSENPAHGVLGAIDNSAMGSATVAYTPMADYHGADAFTFIANNGTQYDVATVQISVTPVNDPPIATSQHIVMQANSAVAITLSGSDVDADALTFSLQDPPAHGTITGTPPNVTYTPAADYTGSDSLAFTANDGTVDADVPASVHITVNPVTRVLAGVAISGAATVAEGSQSQYSLIATYSDGSSADATHSALWSLDNGGFGATIEGGLFTAMGSIIDNVGVTIRVTYTEGGITKETTKPVTVENTVRVLLAVVLAGPTTVDEGQTASYTATAMYDDSITADVTASATWLVAAGPGTIDAGSYTAPATVTADTPAVIQVSYAEDGVVEQAAKNISVADAFAALVSLAVAGPASVAEGGTGTYTATATYDDTSMADVTDAATWSVTTGPGAIANGVYTAPADVAGNTGVTLRAQYSDGGISREATKTLTVTDTTVGNTPPVANDQSASTIEGTAVTITLTGTDVENDPLTFAIVAAPVHGMISGAPPTITYTPNGGFIGFDSLQFKVNDGSIDSATNGTVTVRVNPVGAWTPPIGVPEPAFGIHEVAPASPDPWTGQVEGFYFVDNTHPNATDDGVPSASESDKPYSSTFRGYPDMPRRTIPNTMLPAGTVVEVRGGPYSYASCYILGAGTAESPIFVRGPSSGPRPIFTKTVSIKNETTYLVLEHVELDGAPLNMLAPAHHIAVRHCYIHNVNRAAVAIASWTTDAYLRYAVFYNNVVHTQTASTYRIEEDQDWHGIAVGNRVEHVWIVDNEIAYGTGNAVQVNSGFNAGTTGFVYIGRNHVHHNNQNALAAKGSHDVVFSQNVVHGHRPTPWGSCGAGIFSQYSPERLWLLSNHLFDNENGIACGANVGLYAIGNIVHNIHVTTYLDATGVRLTSQNGEVAAVNNTLFDCDSGIYMTGGAAHRVVNNVVSHMTANNFHVRATNAPVMEMTNNLLFQPTATVRISWNGLWYTSVAALVSGTGHGQGCIEADPAFVRAPNLASTLRFFSASFEGATLGELVDGTGMTRTTLTLDGANFAAVPIRLGDRVQIASGTGLDVLYKCEYADLYVIAIENQHTLVVNRDVTLEAGATNIRFSVRYYPITQTDLYVSDVANFAVGGRVEYADDGVLRTIAAIGSDSFGHKLVLSAPIGANVYPVQPVYRWADAGSTTEDLRLGTSSPGIDAGTLHAVYNWYATAYGVDITAVDFDGNARVQGAAMDIGAFETR